MEARKSPQNSPLKATEINPSEAAPVATATDTPEAEKPAPSASSIEEPKAPVSDKVDILEIGDDIKPAPSNTLRAKFEIAIADLETQIRSAEYLAETDAEFYALARKVAEAAKKDWHHTNTDEKKQALINLIGAVSATLKDPVDNTHLLDCISKVSGQRSVSKILLGLSLALVGVAMLVGAAALIIASQGVIIPYIAPYLQTAINFLGTFAAKLGIPSLFVTLGLGGVAAAGAASTIGGTTLAVSGWEKGTAAAGSRFFKRAEELRKIGLSTQNLNSDYFDSVPSPSTR